jgi:phosphoglycerate dehydrogenase-like enzyme
VLQVAILDDYQSVALASADWSGVRARAQITVFTDHLGDADALVKRLSPFNAICVMRERTPLTAAILEQLPNLKFIGSTGARNSSIDLTAARKHGVIVSSTGSRANGAPELTWALILASARHLRAATAAMHSGGWQVGVGADLEGRTLGVMGLGRIGTRVAAVGRAFGMNIIAWSEHLTAEAARSAGAALVDKATLLREADWLTLHLVLSERTRNIIGGSELRLMKPTAWLVNTARGPLINEASLIEALTVRRIAGAALDVFDSEPLPPDHPFRKLDNVLATPHVGFVTQGAYEVFFKETVENLIAWMDGSPIRIMS